MVADVASIVAVKIPSSESNDPVSNGVPPSTVTVGAVWYPDPGLRPFGSLNVMGVPGANAS